ERPTPRSVGCSSERIAPASVWRCRPRSGLLSGRAAQIAEPLLEPVAIARQLVQILFPAVFRAKRNVVPAMSGQPELAIAMPTPCHRAPPSSLREALATRVALDAPR